MLVVSVIMQVPLYLCFEKFKPANICTFLYVLPGWFQFNVILKLTTNVLPPGIKDCGFCDDHYPVIHHMEEQIILIKFGNIVGEEEGEFFVESICIIHKVFSHCLNHVN